MREIQAFDWLSADLQSRESARLILMSAILARKSRNIAIIDAHPLLFLKRLVLKYILTSIRCNISIESQLIDEKWRLLAGLVQGASS